MQGVHQNTRTIYRGTAPVDPDEVDTEKLSAMEINRKVIEADSKSSKAANRRLILCTQANTIIHI